MKQPQQQNDSSLLISIFPTPVYIAKRNSNLDSTEEIEIEDIIKEGLHENVGNSTTNNSYIFKDRLKKIKQFCEQHLKIYIEQTINPKNELDFYITQSWLNITKPKGFHHDHYHANSLISGVFYVATEEDDKITFGDPIGKVRERVKFDSPKEFNLWNSPDWWLEAKKNELLLFPSWLNHRVMPNELTTTDRISISFNTFVRGTLGDREELTELILK